MRRGTSELSNAVKSLSNPCYLSSDSRSEYYFEIPQNELSCSKQVDTTDVAEMSNPIRFGQEFQGRIANPRDVLTFHRSKRFASRKKNANAEEPVLSIDDPDMPVSEKLQRVRVGTLVKEYLSNEEMQLLGEMGMSDAIQVFVEKDDPHAISS